MQDNTNLLRTGIGMLTLAIIGWIIITLFGEIRQAPWQFLTILIALLGALITFAGNLQIQIRNEQREKKIEIYEKIIHFFFEIIFAIQSGRQQKTEEQIVEFLIEATPTLILWSSDDVLSCFIAFRRSAINSNQEGFNQNLIIGLFGKLILSIRKDLGHQNKNLNELSILSTFVNDVENIF